VSAATNTIASLGLRRRALSLGAVKAFDHAMQFVLPIVLVRCLDTATFGEYRLLWLAVGTLLAVAPLGTPAALFYFLPHSDAPTRRLYVHQAMLLLGATGLLGALALSPLDPWLPATLAPLGKYGELVPAFLALWVTASLLDCLPTAEERIRVQAFATISTSVLRTLLLAAGAWFTGSLAAMLWLLLAVVLFKMLLLLGYVGRFHGWRGPWLRRKTLAGQLRYSAPFGAAAGLYVLRGQADQWVAATLFALHSFAAFSIAAIVGQVVGIFRTSVLEAFFPSMSRMAAAGDMRSAMEMNARANEMTAWALSPMLVFVFAFADDIVGLVYTHAYADAAPVMRVYAVGLVVLVVEISSLIQLLRQGVFYAVLNAVMLGIAILVSTAGGVAFGLAGAAAGSVAAMFLDRVVMLRRIKRLTGVRVRHLQHWRQLARLVALAGLAGLLAWGIAHAWLAGAPHAVRLAAGALVGGLVYGAATWRRYLAPALARR
jgi:O-antigen/teichoic acid export membrane protein